MAVALDTNVLAYAEGVNGGERRVSAIAVLEEFGPGGIVIAAQALGELFAVLTRKARWPAEEARNAVLGWHASFPLVATSESVLLDAMELAASHQFALWDAIMVAAASQAGCRLLLSEDMQDGFIWRGVTIRNPFASRADENAR